MKVLIAIVLLVSLAYAEGAPLRQVQSECPVISDQPVCQFRNGYLFRFSFSFDPIMRVYGRDGRFAFNAPIRIPNAVSTWVWDVAVDSDGSFVAAAVGALAENVSNPKLHGLAMLDANGMQTAFIDTKQFEPGHVAIVR